MELQYYGGNCVRIAGKKAAVTIDDNLAELGLKSVTKAGDIGLFTGTHGDTAKDLKLMIDQPGEYEVSDVSIQGIAARAHMDEEGKLSATIFKVITDDVRIAIVGHIYPELSDKQLEALGTIDILIIPVGGNGYTLDPIGALKVIKKIEPKLVIPTHYAEKGLKYEVPQQELDVAIKELAMEPKETIDKLKLKSSDLVSDVTQLVILLGNSIMKLKAIGFDWGGVINGQPGRIFADRMAELLGVSVVAYRQAYFAHNYLINQGKVTELEFWQLVLKDLDKVQKLQEAMVFVRQWSVIDINQSVLALVDELREQGYRVGLLSNNTAERGQQMRKLGIDTHFDVFHISAETGEVKPEPAAFKLFAAALKVELQELVFIDDTPKSLSTAEECGFNPVLFESYEKLKTQLTELGVL